MANESDAPSDIPEGADATGTVDPPELYDPSAHTVADVLDHLAAADSVETVRVLEAERAGKARKGILEGIQNVAPEPDADGYTRIIISS